jgi:hypothetical protein
MTMRDHLKEVTQRLLSQLVIEERRRWRKTALNDHPPAIAKLSVARRAENAIPLLSAQENSVINREWWIRGWLSASQTRKQEAGIGHSGNGLWLDLRDGSLNKRTRRSAVGEKATGRKRLVPGLVIHLGATSQESNNDGYGTRRPDQKDENARAVVVGIVPGVLVEILCHRCFNQ